MAGSAKELLRDRVTGTDDSSFQLWDTLDRSVSVDGVLEPPPEKEVQGCQVWASSRPRIGESLPNSVVSELGGDPVPCREMRSCAILHEPPFMLSDVEVSGRGERVSSGCENVYSIKSGKNL